MSWRTRRTRRQDPELAARITERNRRERETLRRFAPAYEALDAGVRDEAELLAVEMLTEPRWQPFWLAYEGFIPRFVYLCGEPDARGVRPARVAWDEAITALDAGELPAPAPEQRMLRLAASMAAGVPVSLRDCLIPVAVGWVWFADAVRW